MKFENVKKQKIYEKLMILKERIFKFIKIVLLIYSPNPEIIQKYLNTNIQSVYIRIFEF